MKWSRSPESGTSAPHRTQTPPGDRGTASGNKDNAVPVIPESRRPQGAESAYTPPQSDFIRPTRVPRDPDTANESREPAGNRPEVKVDEIIVPAPESESSSREIPQAGDATGRYRTVSGESSWVGSRVAGPDGVKITYMMSENVAPHRGVTVSPVSERDLAVVDRCTHHVPVIPTRLTPKQLEAKLKEQAEQTPLPQEPIRDGVIADVLYTLKGPGDVVIGVYTEEAPVEKQRKALLDAGMAMDNAESYPTADNKKTAAKAAVTHDMVDASLRGESTVTRTAIVVSAQRFQDAIAVAQQLAASPVRPDYPYAFRVGEYSTDLAAARASIPSTPQHWHNEIVNGILTRLPTANEHPGTPRVVDIGASPNSPEIPAGIPRIAIGVNTESGQPHEVPYMDTQMVIAGASGWGKTTALVDIAGRVVEANQSPEVLGAAGGRSIHTSVAFWSLGNEKEAPVQRLADRIPTGKVVDIQLAATGGEKFPFGIDIMEVPEGYPVSRWMNDFVELSVLGWAADHKNRHPGEDTDASVRALRDRWREVLHGSPTSDTAGLMWKKGWDVELDRSRYKAGRPAALHMEETVAAMMNVVLQQTITGDNNPQNLGEHTRDYGDWIRRNAFGTATGQTGRLLHAKDQKLDTRGILEQGVHPVFSLNGVAQPAFVAAAYMTRLRQDQWALNHRPDAHKYPIIRQFWPIDEAGVLLNNTVGVDFLTELAARGRSEEMGREAGGINTILGVQNLGDLPDAIGINAQTVIVGNTPAGPIQQQIVDSFGLNPAARDRLRNLRPGKSFVKSPYQRNDRVNPVTLPNIEGRDAGRGSIADVREFLRVEAPFETPVSYEVRKPALDFLAEPDGRRFQFHINIAIGAYVDGHGHAVAAQELKKAVASYLNKHIREQNLSSGEKDTLRAQIQDDIVRLAIAKGVMLATSELLRSGIDPQVVARRMASWMPDALRGLNPSERLNFDGTNESFFDAITHDGTFNPVRKAVEHTIKPLAITPKYGVNLECENAITQIRTIDSITTSEVEERYRSLRSALTAVKNTKGQAADALTDTEKDWQTKFGTIPGITVPDNDGRLGHTIGEQLAYLQKWENTVKEDPSLLTGEKWEWLAEQRKRLVAYKKDAKLNPGIPDRVREGLETLYSEIIPDINFAAGSANKQLELIDSYEKAWKEWLEQQGEYRETDLAEIIAPGSGGKSLLETALVAGAEAVYPRWSGHLPFDAKKHTLRARIEQDRFALARILERLIDDSEMHPLGRQRVARVISGIVAETISIENGGSVE